eukprot:m.132474 g.132474  ORF g.132474 m.132474 type:complete len:333 (+) comp17501_c0_seq1:293-1291(+)
MAYFDLRRSVHEQNQRATMEYRLALSVIILVLASTSLATADVFVEILPQGCCRNAEGGSGPNTQYFFGKTQSECESLCAASTTCLGYEISTSGKCELHADDDFVQTNPDPDCRCVARMSDDESGSGSDSGSEDASAAPSSAAPTSAAPTSAAPTTAAPATYAPTTSAPTSGESSDTFVALVPQGCCRNAEGSSGPNTKYHFGQTQESCEALCAASTACRGYEIGTNGKCELHEDDDFDHTKPDSDCRCVEKVLGSASGAESDNSGSSSSAAATLAPVAIGLGLIVLVAVVGIARWKRATSTNGAISMDAVDTDVTFVNLDDSHPSDARTSVV